MFNNTNPPWQRSAPMLSQHTVSAPACCELCSNYTDPTGQKCKFWTFVCGSAENGCTGMVDEPDTTHWCYFHATVTVTPPTPGTNNSAPGVFSGSVGPMPPTPPTCNTSTFFHDSIPWARSDPIPGSGTAGGPTHCCEHCSQDFVDPATPGQGCRYWSYDGHTCNLHANVTMVTPARSAPGYTSGIVKA